MCAQVAPLLSRKLKKVLETRTDSPDLQASLSTLSTFYTENNSSNRKNLRSTLERRGLSINEEFLSASESTQKALDAVDMEVNGLAECCERISSALSKCSVSTGDMVSATERLKSELEHTLRRQQLVASFLHNYQLTPDEIAALREEDLDERFFSALSRVQEIHSNCKVLLRTHHQRAGLELMEVMSMYQEGAYERLCRWVQAECRALGDSDTPEVSDVLRTAAVSLRDRPVLFKYCAEEVANTRHNALFRRFISALTRGGPGGMPRPIEVHAHDPLRYVGDMLAWLHQALASERELASALFSTATQEQQQEQQQQQTGKGSGGGGGGGGGGVDMASVLDRVFEGVCRPFRVRVEQVVTAPAPNTTAAAAAATATAAAATTANASNALYPLPPGAPSASSASPASPAPPPQQVVTAYRLHNLLAFYTHTISALLGPDKSLSVTLADVCQLSHRTLFDMLKTRGDRLLRYPPAVSVADLAPPPALSDTLAVLLELLDSHRQHLLVGEGMTKPDFQPVMDAMLDPLLEMCERASESLGSSSGSSSTAPSLLRKSSQARLGVNESISRSRNSSSASLMAGNSSGSLRSFSVSKLSGADAAGTAAFTQEGIASMRATFMINCLTAIQQPLIGHDVAAARVASLSASIDKYVASLVDVHVAEILRNCNLDSKLALVASSQPEGPPLASHESMNPAAVSESLRALFALLAGNEGSLPEFEKIQMPRVKSDACYKVSSALADSYRVIFTALMNPVNQYPDPRSVLRHTPEQMKTILGI